jgi:glycosyltransferase involved in cell wall biosynthesis
MNHYNNNNSAVIANGVDKNIVVSNKKSDLRKEYNISNNTKIIVGVGSLREQKNYPFWVELANACKDTDIHFFVCGGHYGQGYIDSSLFDGIENLTWLSVRSDVSEIINEANCFLSCSTFEGLPIAVLEAFFAGIPCVLSPIPQHSDIARNISECYIPDNFEVPDFKEKIITASSSGKSHESIQKEREPFLENFSIERTAKEYIDFYKKSILI